MKIKNLNFIKINLQNINNKIILIISEIVNNDIKINR
jgi:hypothetical protein